MLRFRWAVVIAGLCMLMNMAWAADSPGDPDLVMHYTFDQDEGRVVTDHSSHGNSAENTNGRWLAEVQGRSGVMRFNGVDAMLTAQNPSLVIEGDSTISMWIRRNVDELHSRCYIFSDPGGLDWYFADYIHFIIWSYWSDPLVGHERQSFPMDHDMFVAGWNHITVVFEHPRARVYQNGKLRHDFWMVHPMMMNSTKKTIGGDGRAFGFFDLDDFRLYRRALSAAEVRAVFEARPLPVISESEIMLEPYWYENSLVVRLSSRNSAPVDGSMTVRLTSNDGKTATRAVRLKASASSGSARTVGEAGFELSGFASKPGKAVVDIFDRNKVKISTVTKAFTINKPDWVYNNIGIPKPNKVPAPWTPVKVTKAGAGMTFDVWGRRYTLGNTPFFSQVRSQGADILAEPMRVNAVVDGKPVDFVYQGADLSESKPDYAAFTQRFKSDAGLSLNVNCRLEYDGFARFRMQLQSDKAIRVDQLFFEMPVKKERALYAHGQEVYPLDPQTENYVKSSHRGFTGDKDLSWMFTCNAYLGDDYRFLAWQAESEQHWAYSEKMRALEVLPREDVTTFRARIIDVPTEMSSGKSREIEFAIMATPAKPGSTTSFDLATARSEPYGRDLDWGDRRMPDGTLMLDNVKRLGVKRLLMTGGMEVWPYPMPLTKDFSRMLKRNVDVIHRHGVKVINYVIHQRFPANMPEYEFNASNMANRPFITYSAGGAKKGTPRPGPLVQEYGVPSQDTYFVCPKSRALQDAYVYSMWQRLKTFKEDGVYLDGTSAHVPPCKNLEHGCGYIGSDGKAHETYPVFAVREYARRIFLANKSVNPENKVDVHCSFGYNPSALTYVDSIWTGEHWWHLRGKGTDYVHAEFPLDMFRSEFTGRQLNIPVDVLTYRLGDIRRVLATSLLHDVPGRSSTWGNERRLDVFDPNAKEIELLSRIWRLRSEFGVQDAALRLYYENSEWVKCGPEDCYTSLLVHPRNGVLAIVSNLTREKQRVSVIFNLKTLGLEGLPLEVVDTMWGMPVALDTNGTVALDLDSEQWTYLWLKPAGKNRQAGSANK